MLADSLFSKQHQQLFVCLAVSLSDSLPACWSVCVSVRVSICLSDCLSRSNGRTSVVNAGPDSFLLEALFRNEVWGFMQMPVSRQNEEAVCKSMVDGCRCGTNALQQCFATHDTTA